MAKVVYWVSGKLVYCSLVGRERRERLWEQEMGNSGGGGSCGGGGPPVDLPEPIIDQLPDPPIDLPEPPEDPPEPPEDPPEPPEDLPEQPGDPPGS